MLDKLIFVSIVIMTVLALIVGFIAGVTITGQAYQYRIEKIMKYFTQGSDDKVIESTFLWEGVSLPFEMLREKPMEEKKVESDGVFTAYVRVRPGHR